MPSRGQAITLQYVAWDTSANQGKVADLANHTLRWIKNGVAAAPTNTPSEVDPVNAAGVYSLALTATECTCDFGTLAGKSLTASVSIIPISVAFEQLPTAVPGTSGGLPALPSTLLLNTNMNKWAGQSVTVDANNLPNVAVKDWNGVAVGNLPVNFAALAIDGSGVAQTNVVQVLGSTATLDTFPSATAIATAVVNDTADMVSPPTGSLGAKINAAGSAGDPWATAEPGSYSAGTFGALIATNLDAKVSLTSRPATPQTIDTTTVLAYRDQRTGSAHTSPTLMDAFTGAHFAAWGTEAAQSDGTTNAIAPDGTTVVFNFAAQSLGQVQLAPNGLDLVMIESGVNARQALCAAAAESVGVLAGAGTGTIVIKGANTATTRITATTDSLGNRQAITLNLPA